VQIARVKLQHDLFDRRYGVFDATRKLLANICAKGNASEEDMRACAIYSFQGERGGEVLVDSDTA
jgi:hypothetical protein